MLTTFLALAALVTAQAQTPPDTRHELRDGLYAPVRSNNRSVCPQLVKTFKVDGKLSALEVTYVGDCYEWGPFEYYCLEEASELICSSPHQIEFVIRSHDKFHWVNKPYEIWADFELNANRQ